MANMNSQTAFQQEVIHLSTPEREGKLAQLTISYRLSGDGRRLADDFCTDLNPGQPFSVQSPQVPGFYTTDINVSGVMPENGNDLNVTVFYEACRDWELDYEPTLQERIQQSRWFKPVVLVVATVLCIISMHMPSPVELLWNHLFPPETVVEEAAEEVPIIERHGPTSVSPDPSYADNSTIGGGMNVEDTSDYIAEKTPPRDDFQPDHPYPEKEPHEVPGDSSVEDDADGPQDSTWQSGSPATPKQDRIQDRDFDTPGNTPF